MTRTKMCASPRVTPSSLPLPISSPTTFATTFSPPRPPRCLLLLRGRHRPRFLACRHHHRNNSNSSISRSISKVRTRRLPPGGTTASRSLPLSSANTHTTTTKTTKTSCLFFVVRYMRAPLLCVCPPSVSLVVIYNTYMLLAKILLSLLPTTYDTSHTHGEIKSTNISHHTRTLEHTHHFTHPSMEGGSQRSGS